MNIIYCIGLNYPFQKAVALTSVVFAVGHLVKFNSLRWLGVLN